MKITKILSLLLAVVLMLTAFAACGKELEDYESKPKKTSSRIKNDRDDDDKNNNRTDRDDNDQQATVTPTRKYKAGARTDDEFSSEYLGFNYKLQKGFEMMSDEDIAALMNIGEDMYEDTFNTEVDWSKIDAYYEMYAMDRNGNSIIIISEKCAGYDEEDYWKSIKTQRDAMHEDATFTELETVELAGIGFKAAEINYTQSGVKLSQSYVMRAYGDYMCTIILTALDEEGAEALIAGFEEYSKLNIA